MRKISVLGVLVVLLSLSAFAQSSPSPASTSAGFPAVEVFGGFSYLRLDTAPASRLNTAFGLAPGTLSVKQNYPGWNGALQFNVTHWLGVEADASGHYGTPVSASSSSGFPSASFHNFLFGPVVTFRHNRARPFVHALFGFDHLSTNASAALGLAAISDDAFAAAIGGGLDLRVSRRISLRVVQADYLYTGHDTTPFGGVGHQNNIRVSGGVVLNFLNR
jgi:hypothetical protein